MATPEFDSETCFGNDGRLARAVPGYRPRAEQGAMAAAVWEALRRERALAVEAGTGVGKTLAYLMPVLASGRKTLIATGTRHLQDQLFQKDLPVALGAARTGSRVCLLKGRANYLCRHRYQAYAAGGLGQDAEASSRKLRVWASDTETGDLAELDCPEDDPVIPAITSTLENCLGKACPEYEDCFVVRARERAKQADLVIANHHLFAADLALREDSLGELLPEFEVRVFDEAHKLAEVLEGFWSNQWSTGRIQQLCRDTEAVAQREPDGNQALTLCARGVRRALKQVTAQLQTALEGTAPGARVPPPEGFAERVRPLVSTLGLLRQEVEDRRQDSPDIENLAERCGRLTEELAGWPSGEGECCEYLILTGQGFTLHQVPIDINGVFAKAQARTRDAPCWVFTSATLSVGGDFDYFIRKLGLGAETDTLQLDSPFDFQAQTRLYLPPGLPDPRTSEYNEAMLAAVLPLLEQLRGRTFLLFTSLRAMAAAGRWLEGRLDCTLLKQGDAPRRKLLERFTEQSDALLLGSVGFWEGVDIPGPALSCVIIDKIPFVSHTDLLYQARMDAIREAGGDPFRQLQLPRAALMLKQGVGRLIRSVTDRGVAVIADPRLQSQWYGRILKAGLPDMPVSTDLEHVLGFLRERVA